MPPYQERWVERDGNKIYVRDYPGPEPAIVLMHGFPDYSVLYDRVVPLLNPARRVVTFDFIGWGYSDKPRGHAYTFASLEADLAAVLAALGLERPVLVGHDASGPPALEWSLANEAKAGELVLLNTFYMMMLTLRPPEGVFLYMMPGLKHLARLLNWLSGQQINRLLYFWQIGRFISDRAERRERVALLYQKWPEAWPAFAGIVGRLFAYSIGRGKAANLARLRNYGGRVRIIFGTRDPYLNVTVAERLHRELPRSELFLLPRAHHYVQIDEPAEVARLILEVAQPRASAAP